MEQIPTKDAHVRGTGSLLEHAATFTEPRRVAVNGSEYIVLPRVFDPEVFFSSGWFAARIPTLLRVEEADFLEIGSGTGIIAVAVARAHPHLHVSASDINPAATENTAQNAALYGVADRIDPYTGDVFDGLAGTGRTFDTIFWAMPFGYIPIETPISVYEAQVHDPGYRAIGKFFTEARSYLKPGGRLLIGFSSDIGNVDEITRLATANRFSFTLLESTKGMEHEPVSMEIWESRPEEI